MLVSQYMHRQAAMLKHIIKIVLSFNPNVQNARRKIAYVLLFLFLFYIMQHAQFLRIFGMNFPMCLCLIKHTG